MKQFSENVPKELLESDKIGGCNELRTFSNIVLPIVKPGVASLAIFTFINTWNDYFMQLVMPSDNLSWSCNTSGRVVHKLWFDHGRCSAGCGSDRYCISCVPEVIYTGNYNGSSQRLERNRYDL